MVEIARIVRTYAAVLAWPIVAVVAVLVYRKVIPSMLPGAKIKLIVFGLTIQTSIPVLEQSVRESLGGRGLTKDQLSLLQKLRSDGRAAVDKTQLEMARRLRNAGLIRHCPEEEYLQNATEIEITILGRLLVEAAENQ